MRRSLNFKPVSSSAPSSSHSASSTSSNWKLFTCLYSSQKLKKKKSWCDGVVKVSVNNGFCRLCSQETDYRIGVSNNSLDSLQLTDAQLKSLLANDSDIELDFEKYIVTIETGSEIMNSGSASSAINATVAVCAPKKPLENIIKKAFKVPKQVNPVEVVSKYENVKQSAQLSGQVTSIVGSKRGLYEVDGADIDNLWGDDEPKFSSDDSISKGNGSNQDFVVHKSASINDTDFSLKDMWGPDVTNKVVESIDNSTYDPQFHSFNVDPTFYSSNESDCSNKFSDDSRDDFDRHFDERDSFAVKTSPPLETKINSSEPYQEEAVAKEFPTGDELMSLFS